MAMSRSAGPMVFTTLPSIETVPAEIVSKPAIILKVGAHCGPSIAVTLNDNLDYFGQTVNVAARVQSLAEAGEVCISEALHAAPGVAELFAGREVVPFDAPLRGVEGEASVYRIMPA